MLQGQGIKMNIQELATKSGLSKDTIRYYERIGLLPKPKRGINGYREYNPSMIINLKLLNHAKQLGFSLKELKALTQLFLSKKLNQKEMGLRLQKKLIEIDIKIAALNELKENIRQVVSGNCDFSELIK
jgi:MerR family copper efflux transcriptional regulator